MANSRTVESAGGRANGRILLFVGALLTQAERVVRLSSGRLIAGDNRPESNGCNKLRRPRATAHEPSRRRQWHSEVRLTGARRVRRRQLGTGDFNSQLATPLSSGDQDPRDPNNRRVARVLRRRQRHSTRWSLPIERAASLGVKLAQGLRASHLRPPSQLRGLPEAAPSGRLWRGGR